MDHVDYAYTLGMDEGEIEDRLGGAETGVLALANGDDAYAVPLAHHYDEGRLYRENKASASGLDPEGEADT